MKKSNIFQNIPSDLTQELFETVVESKNVKIERIISYGQSSQEEEWYDQDENEWVVLLEGEAMLAFDDGAETHLQVGDSINIPAHVKHKVLWTKKEAKTIWLAVFYK
ncbi:cupin domain-containing protein [Sulfurimonas paralvinellae]|uniref:Cupin domain-containing protein n=1 Tax=Sulfurimonas paralvinellae TaxID=317658 RepID=A0A7M1B8P1_9BACT|nr:cupin domain-containing protein [Sulfurimonas paralvinellae]QOP46099.1 cupin domain-containing protein [Sulfurimonas paralvinellae]